MSCLENNPECLGTLKKIKRNKKNKCLEELKRKNENSLKIFSFNILIKYIRKNFQENVRTGGIL